MGDNESDKIQIELRRRNTNSYHVLCVYCGLAKVSRTIVVDLRHIFTVINMNGTFPLLYGICSQHLDDMTYVMCFKIQPPKLTTKAYFSGHA